MKYLVKFKIGERHFKHEVEATIAIWAKKKFYREIEILEVEPVIEPEPEIVSFLKGIVNKKP
jgi:hypothetical protein